MFTNQEVIIEQEILGLIFSNNSLVTVAKDIIKPEMFLIQGHRAIYEGIVKMINDGITVDVVNFLEKYREVTKDMGGIAYISQIGVCAVTEEGFESKLELLIEKYKRKKLQDISKKLLNSRDVDKMTKAVEDTLEEIYKSSMKKDIDIVNQYDEYLNWLYFDNKDRGFKSGLEKIDSVLGNFQRGRLITIFARSGVGKSTMALQIAANMVKDKHKVIYASGEMSNNEIFSKMAASNCLIEYKKIINNNISEEEKDKISSYVSTLVNNSFYITNEIDIDLLIREIKLYKMKNSLDVVFVDYVNKYTGGIKALSLTEKIGQVTSKLKDLALKEDICVVLLAQANRLVDKSIKENLCEKISESDIQDSARIEQDSDQLIALYRNKNLDNKVYRDELMRESKLSYKSKNAEVNPKCINAIILKNRHGEKGTKALTWFGEYSRIENFIENRINFKTSGK
ncbi:replicative DNA helicase [Clostridium carnis]